MLYYDYVRDTWIGDFIIESGLTESQLNEISDKCNEAINECGDDDCCDNLRISINENNEEAYQDALDDGCCGFYDTEFELKDGTKVKFGFNYGH